MPTGAAAPLIPRDAAGRPRSLHALAEAAASCTACPLYLRATRTVFGEGQVGARLMLVGEQPGDVEDRRGRPFVGPAGAVLDEALAAAGVPRPEVYVTNAVKHFKFVQQGKRRLHQKPRGLEVRACQPWLAAEIALVEPALVVAMGATAAESLLGPRFQLTQHRGEAVPSPLGATVVATYHPSAVLRAREPEQRHALFDAFVGDLARAWALAAARQAPSTLSP
jgi:DNA polymerase